MQSIELWKRDWEVFAGWGSTQSKAWQESPGPVINWRGRAWWPHTNYCETGAKAAEGACGSFPYTGQKSREGAWGVRPCKGGIEQERNIVSLSTDPENQDYYCS